MPLTAGRLPSIEGHYIPRGVGFHRLYVWVIRPNRIPLLIGVLYLRIKRMVGTIGFEPTTVPL